MTCHAALQLGEFERRLRRERRQVLHALVTTDAELAGLERARPDELIDRAATETTGRLLSCLEERERHALEEIDAAKARLSTGTFGVCEMCKGWIASGRLRALPATRLCVTCEEKVELTQRR